MPNLFTQAAYSRQVQALIEAAANDGRIPDDDRYLTPQDAEFCYRECEDGFTAEETAALLIDERMEKLHDQRMGVR